MQIVLVSQCTKSLQFSPFRQWPTELPSLAWRNHLVTGFESEQAVSVGDDIEHLSQLLRFYYPELSLVELAFLKRCLEKIEPAIFPKLVEQLQWRFSQELEETLEVILQLPINFQAWCHRKKIGVRDLAPLKSIGQETITPLLNVIAQKDLAKNFGVQILELAAELLLLELTNERLLQNADKSVETWLNDLRTLRFPNTSALDEQSQRKLKNLSWPPKVDVQWVRKGDISGLRVEFFCASQLELEKKLTSLKHVTDDLRANPEKLWTQNS